MGDLELAFLLSVALGITSLTLGTGEGAAPRQNPDTQQDSLLPTLSLFSSSMAYLAHTSQRHGLRVPV